MVPEPLVLSAMIVVSLVNGISFQLLQKFASSFNWSPAHENTDVESLFIALFGTWILSAVVYLVSVRRTSQFLLKRSYAVSAVMVTWFIFLSPHNNHTNNYALCLYPILYVLYAASSKSDIRSKQAEAVKSDLSSTQLLVQSVWALIVFVAGFLFVIAPGFSQNLYFSHHGLHTPHMNVLSFFVGTFLMNLAALAYSTPSKHSLRNSLILSGVLQTLYTVLIFPGLVRLPMHAFTVAFFVLAWFFSK